MSEENLKQLRADLKKAERNSNRIYVRLKKLREQTPLKVSDHALVRYLERVEDIPVEEAREKLLSPVVVECYQLLGNGTFPIDREGSARVVVADGVIVTVYV